MDLAAAAASLASQQTPILIVDTCSFLDILRIYRGDIPLELLAAVRKIIAGSQSTPPTVRVFITDTIRSELKHNRPIVLAEAKKKLKEIDNRHKQVWEIICDFREEPELQSKELFIDLGLDCFLDDLLDSFMATVLQLTERDICNARAYARVVQKKRPVLESGEKGTKDASIVEHTFEFARLLRGMSVTTPIIFTTSNTKDFTDNSKINVHPDLEPDFTALDIKLAVSLNHAVHLAGL